MTHDSANQNIETSYRSPQEIWKTYLVEFSGPPSRNSLNNLVKTIHETTNKHQTLEQYGTYEIEATLTVLKNINKLLDITISKLNNDINVLDGYHYNLTAGNRVPTSPQNMVAVTQLNSVITKLEEEQVSILKVKETVNCKINLIKSYLNVMLWCEHEASLVFNTL